MRFLKFNTICVSVLLVLAMCSSAFATNWTYRWYKPEAQVERVNVCYAADGSIETFGVRVVHPAGAVWLNADLTLTDMALNRILSQALTAYSSKGEVSFYLKNGNIVGIELK